MVPFCSWCVLFFTSKGHLFVGVVTSSGSAGGDTDSDSTNVTDWVSTGFSQHTVCGRGMKTTHQSMPAARLNRSLVAMCFLMTGHHVWWLQWIHCWCWTALCGSPPHCSAPPWAAGSRSLRPGLNWRCCSTLSWLPPGSAACCSERWTVTTSDEVWSLRWPPGLWIHVSACKQWHLHVKIHSHTSTPDIYPKVWVSLTQFAHNRFCVLSVFWVRKKVLYAEKVFKIAYMWSC